MCKETWYACLLAWACRRNCIGVDSLHRAPIPRDDPTRQIAQYRSRLVLSIKIRQINGEDKRKEYVEVSFVIILRNPLHG